MSHPIAKHDLDTGKLEVFSETTGESLLKIYTDNTHFAADITGAIHKAEKIGVKEGVRWSAEHLTKTVDDMTKYCG